MTLHIGLDGLQGVNLRKGCKSRFGHGLKGKVSPAQKVVELNVFLTCLPG
jgi:hypothetical protein